jgi:RND family efflux transporter MFP subunit
LHPPDRPKSPATVDKSEAAFDSFDETAREGEPTHESDGNAPVHGASHALDEKKVEPDTHGHVPVATTYDPGTGRRLQIFAGAFAVILAIAFFVVHHIRGNDQESLAASTAARAEQPTPVEVVKVDNAPATQVLTLPGGAKGWYTSTIYARVNGYLANWVADIGDRVKKDQVLATIDTPDLDAQLSASQAQLNAEEAEVKVKEAEARFAKSTYDRWRESPVGVVSKQETEAKMANYDTSTAQLNAARAKVKLDQANVDRLTFLTKFKQVTAPFDGVITQRQVDIGDLVTAGSTANTSPLYGITQSDKIRVFVDVPQSASAQIADGTVAQVAASELPGRSFDGKVARTSRSIDLHARTLRVEVDLDNSDLALLPGMYVQVTFHLKPTTFVQVPASALLFRASGPQVAVVDNNDTVTFKDVSIARDDGSAVLLASGVSKGDRVALNISNQIGNGDKVTVTNDTAATATKKLGAN